MSNPPVKIEDNNQPDSAGNKDKRNQHNNTRAGQYGQGNQKKGNVPWPTTSKFEGNCDALKGFIYDCSDNRQADRFTKTTLKIGEYVGSNYTRGKDISRLVETLKVPVIDMPAPPAEDANASVMRVWQKNIDKFVDRQDQLQENIGSLYSLLRGQCTDIMKQRLESLPTYDKLNEDRDGLGLLIEIKNIAFSFQSQNYLAHSLHDSKRRFYMYQQDKHTTTQAYFNTFINNVKVIEHSGGTVAGRDPGLESMVATEKGYNTNMTAEQMKQVQEESRERYLAVAFLLGAD